MTITARRVGAGPIIDPGLSPRIGSNINGPSLVETPDWAPRRLGRYLLYFAAHEGTFIRLAFADRMDGPWTVHEPGAIDLSETPFAQAQPDIPQPAWAAAEGVNGLYPHIASPDVEVDHRARRFTMLLHGLDADGWQRTVRAISADGLSWTVEPRRLSDEVYLRRFTLGGQRYAIGLGARILREQPDGSYQRGPRLVSERTHRHPAVLVRDGRLHLFSHRIGDAPERLLHMVVDTEGDWQDWRAGPAHELLAPELGWEGGDLPVAPSRLAGLHRRARQLRDPHAFEAEGRVWLAYAGAGESAIGLVELTGL